MTVVDLIRRNAGRIDLDARQPISKKNPDAYLGADNWTGRAIMTAAESSGRDLGWYIIESTSAQVFRRSDR